MWGFFKSRCEIDNLQIGKDYVGIFKFVREFYIWASPKYVLATAYKRFVFKGRKFTKSILFRQIVTRGISKTEFADLVSNLQIGKDYTGIFKFVREFQCQVDAKPIHVAMKYSKDYVGTVQIMVVNRQFANWQGLCRDL
jgi:hypothetical protein